MDNRKGILISKPLFNSKMKIFIESIKGLSAHCNLKWKMYRFNQEALADSRKWSRNQGIWSLRSIKKGGFLFFKWRQQKRVIPARYARWWVGFYVVGSWWMNGLKELKREHAVERTRKRKGKGKYVWKWSAVINGSIKVLDVIVVWVMPQVVNMMAKLMDWE